jgi:hypothetical protein
MPSNKSKKKYLPYSNKKERKKSFSPDTLWLSMRNMVTNSPYLFPQTVFGMFRRLKSFDKFQLTITDLAD